MIEPRSATRTAPPIERKKASGRRRVSNPEQRDLATGTAPFTTPGGTQLTSILLKSTPITQENLNIVLDTGQLTKDQICQDVDPASAPAVCR